MFPVTDSVPRRCPPIVTWTIIISCGIIFLFEASLPQPYLEQLIHLFGIIPAVYTDPDWADFIGLVPNNLLPLFTSMFLHGSWIHIIGNMWTLWIFGDNVEDEMGHLRFFLFYILCGLAAAWLHILTNPLSTVPTIGASGAIAGVMGAYYLLFPSARIVIMIPLFFIPFFFEVPAFFFLAYWFLTQIFGGAFALATPQQAGGIAWWAHIGGFVFGMLTYRFFLAPEPCRRRYKDQNISWGLYTPRDRY